MIFPTIFASAWLRRWSYGRVVPQSQAAARFKVSIASAVRWVKRFQTTGEIWPRTPGGDRRSGRIRERIATISWA